MSNDTALEVRGITKTFPGTRALDDVGLSLQRGEVHAVVGENGAGKSTLMKIIDGIYQPDCGEIVINGNVVDIRNPYDAQQLGIGFVHQEIALCQHISVAENIFMADINSQSRELVPYKEYNKQAKKLIGQFNASIEPETKVSRLSISNQQIVEIVKALSLDCKIIIFDEPTAALTETEAEALFAIIRRLKSDGISILYISHRMAEIFGNCDRVTILRDGRHIDTLVVSETDEITVVNKMVGRNITDLYPPKNKTIPEQNEVLLEIQNYSSNTDFHDISFSLYKGEILGFAGLIGAGRSEVIKAVCGLHSKSRGETFLRGKRIKITSYRDAIDHGIVYLTEDRKSEGLFLRLNIRQNISAVNLDQVSSGLLLDKKAERKLTDKFVKKMRIRCSGISQSLESLSGGNQQKVLLSKLLAINPAILFMDEPTRGIDVGAKSEIHILLRNLTNEGVGVVLISSEMPEIIGMCDRVIVMHEGRISGIVSKKDLNETTLIHLASGITKEYKRGEK